MIDPREVIRRPIVTEKSMRGTTINKYTFEVGGGASKPVIRDAVERLFQVHVTKVNVIRIRGRQRRRGQHYYHEAGYRKAVVTLASGDKIDLEKLT
ncbi:MAG TPA: 50S ribosomal protein L23 [bacterium]|nr:50S ribosomal protein L23 [bacterium]